MHRKVYCECKDEWKDKSKDKIKPKYDTRSPISYVKRPKWGILWQNRKLTKIIFKKLYKAEIEIYTQ